jgi:hypothetical protein
VQETLKKFPNGNCREFGLNGQLRMRNSRPRIATGTSSSLKRWRLSPGNGTISKSWLLKAWHPWGGWISMKYDIQHGGRVMYIIQKEDIPLYDIHNNFICSMSYLISYFILAFPSQNALFGGAHFYLVCLNPFG